MHSITVRALVLAAPLVALIAFVVLRVAPALRAAAPVEMLWLAPGTLATAALLITALLRGTPRAVALAGAVATGLTILGTYGMFYQVMARTEGMTLIASATQSAFDVLLHTVFTAWIATLSAAAGVLAVWPNDPTEEQTA